MHLMVLLYDVDQVEACFGLLGDSVSDNARWVHSLHRTCNRLENHFDTPDGTTSDVGQVEACLGLFGDSVNLDIR
jgi:hypothetical protein